MTYKTIVSITAVETCRQAVIDLLIKEQVGFRGTCGKVRRIQDWSRMPADIKEVWVLVTVMLHSGEELEILVQCLIDREANYNVTLMYYKRELLWSFIEGTTDKIDKLKQ